MTVMKKSIQTIMITLLLAGAGFTATAQEEETVSAPRTTPRWVSAKGYWIVESNIRDPRHSLVYFYTNDDILVHKETIDGVKLSVKRDRTKMKLKKALEIVVNAWAAGHPYDSTGNAVAALLTK